MQRIRQLPEFEREELDLPASLAVWLPSRQRAEEVERSMHKCFSPHRCPAGHRGDGHMEWFRGASADRAVRLLNQMPVDDSGTRTARTVPISLPAPPSDAVSIESGPQDVWWRVEDVLTRLGMQLPLTISGDDRPQVTVHGFKQFDAHRTGDLRRAALDVDTYQCWQDGRPRGFVQFIRLQGDDLVLDFASLRAVEAWDGGLELVWQVRGFLARLRRVARIRRSS